MLLAPMSALSKHSAHKAAHPLGFGFSVFLLRLHPGLRFFHCLLRGFQFCPVLQEHLIDDAQIPAGFLGQCLASSSRR